MAKVKKIINDPEIIVDAHGFSILPEQTKRDTMPGIIEQLIGRNNAVFVLKIKAPDEMRKHSFIQAIGLPIVFPDFTYRLFG